MYLVAVVTVLVCAFVPDARADDVSDALSAIPTATIADGPLIGTTTSIAGPSSSIIVNKFLGIPYAAAPTGEARFSPPKGPSPWTLARNATQQGSSCIQVFAPLDSRPFIEAVFNNPPPKSESEDCLFINVFAPKKAWDPNTPPYPVALYLYGGAWIFGNAAHPWYDGSHFAGLEDVIFVSINYRTNVFGLPMSPEVANVTERNLGLLDQRAGLQWIQDNIHHFGGDRSRVIILGQSAGAYSVDVLVTSYGPDAPRPFSGAIMQSGTYAYQYLPNCNNNDYRTWDALAQASNCTGTDSETFNCIKNLRTAQQLKDAQERANIRFGHACDNITFVSNPRLRLESGNVANVPILLGTDTADGSFYAIPYAINTTEYFEAYFPGNTTLKNEVLAAYPLGSEGRTDPQYQLQQIHTDWAFHCPDVWYAETSSKRVDTYRYLYNATFANTRAQLPQWPVPYQGAYHFSEIPIVLTTYNASSAEPTEKELSDTMRRAWANFVKDPTQKPLEIWDAVGKGENGADIMKFGVDGKASSEMVVDSNHCDVWERLGFREHHL